jgi:hypothetical protein
MNRHADAYFRIGNAHQRNGLPAQDYALATTHEHTARIVVSDGCSGGKRTDVGARILAHSIHESLVATTKSDSILSFAQASAVIERAESLSRASAHLLGLDSKDMRATGMVAQIGDTGGFALVLGDGVIGIARADGSIECLEVVWQENIPYYPAYRSYGLTRQFIEEHGGNDSAPRILVRRTTETSDGRRDTTEEQRTLKEGVDGIYIAIPETELQSIRALGLFSDGVSQISGVDTVTAVRAMLTFPTKKGVFLVRTMKHVLASYERNGNIPQDDVSGAVIIQNEESP